MSNWKQDITTLLAEILRLSIRACLLVDGILIAMATVWFCGKFLYYSVNWLNRTMFDSPW